MSFLNLELALFSVMARLALWLTRQLTPLTRCGKRLGVSTEKEKEENTEQVLLGGQKRNLYINGVVMQVPINVIEKFRMSEEVRVSNCWYGRVFIRSWFS